MNRNEMIMYLHEFDSDLKMPVTLVVCGASAAILNHGLKRNSFDIDVMNTSVPLELLKESIEKVAKNHRFDHKWLNDDSKIIYTRLSKNYEVDTDIIANEKFKYLNVHVITKPDFIITKLAYYDQIRNKDISDIKLIELGVDDIKRFYKKVDKISISRQIDALKIESIFKQIRPEMVKTLEGYSFHSENDIFDYCRQRYSFTPPDSIMQEWKSSLSSMDTKSGLIIANIDWNAAEQMQKCTLNLHIDKQYRISRVKEYGFEL